LPKVELKLVYGSISKELKEIPNTFSMLEEYILLNMEEDVNKAISDYLAVVFTYDICYKDN